MNKVEVVDKTTTTSTKTDTVQPQQHSLFNSEIICSSGICVNESECSQTKTKQVLFDLDIKRDDVTSTTNTNNCNDSIRRLSNTSNTSSKRSSSNKKSNLAISDCHRKSGQQQHVEINMDSIVVAKTSSSSSNTNANSINNRLRNLIEIFRNTFNASSTSSSSSNTPNKKTKNKRHNSLTSQQKQQQQQSVLANEPSKVKSSSIPVDTPDDEMSLCQLCYHTCSTKNKQDGSNYMYNLDTCEHSFCIECLRLYLKYQIIESRVSISCPQCNEKMHPNDIYRLLSLTNLITSIDKLPLSNSYFNTLTGINPNAMSASSSPSTSSSSSSSSSSSNSSTETPSKKLISSEPKSDLTTTTTSNNKKTESSTKTTPTTTKKIINLQEQQQNWPTLIQKYEEFMLRRVLVTIPDTRWCPAPDCTYAVIASGCANCPQLYCMRPNCNTSFCYHCKQYWHPNLTCEDAAIRNNQSPYGMLMNLDTNNNASSNATGGPTNAPSTNKLIRSFLQRSNSHISTGSSNTGGFNIATNAGAASTAAINTVRFGSDVLKEEIKRCPKCQALIVKMDDGSCNHITCAVCGCEFCWLCMKEISDLHYLSPSGCTFWGKKPWSRKKKILWQLGILIGAPVGIALIAGVAVPAILIGLPIWSGRKVYVRYKSMGKHKRNLIVLGTVVGTVLVAPLVAALAVGIGVPILLAYVYGVVPISLCRSGGCGVTTNNNGGVRFAFDDETTDNINFFTYNNTTNNNEPSQQASIVSSSVSKKQHTDKSTSVKIPISAIEPKPDNILMVRSSPHDANDPNSNSNEAGTCRPQTPVLVTITLANKSSKLSKNNSSSTSASTSTKLKQSKVKRNKSASNSKETDKKKHKIKNNLTTHKSSSIATSCGSVELLKLNKTNDEFDYANDLASKDFKSIAAELVNETGPISSLTNQKSKLSNTTNTSDFEANLSSSSSHHLIESSSTNKAIRQEDKENMHSIKIKSNNQKQKMNPSIGEMSIGAYTNTSLSADIINVDDDDDEDDSEDEDDEDNNEDGESNFQYDQENSSTKAIASGSIKKYSIESTKTNVISEKLNEFNKSNKIEKKMNYEKPIDTYSVSIISEKSINPSVAALAGSIKDNQSVDNISATDDRISYTTSVQLKIN